MTENSGMPCIGYGDTKPPNMVGPQHRALSDHTAWPGAVCVLFCFAIPAMDPVHSLVERPLIKVVSGTASREDGGNR